MTLADDLAAMRRDSREQGEFDLFRYFLDSPLVSVSAKLELFNAWHARHPYQPRVPTNPTTLIAKGVEL